MSNAFNCNSISIVAADLADLSLRVNSLGDRESKERYRDALVAISRPETESAE